MDMRFMLALLAAFCGLPIGMIIARMTREELRAGQRYFRLMANILFSLCTMIFAYSMGAGAVLSAIAGIALMAAVQHARYEKMTYVAYPLIALMLGLTRGSGFLAQSGSLAFLFGLPAGAMVQAKGRWYEVILLHAPFLLIGLAFSFF